jgi:hypothetical protein
MIRSVALVAAAALALLPGLPAAAQQTAADDGTNANGPITILKNYVAESTPVTVLIDGKEIDDLRSATYDDITTSVHGGLNTLTVTWQGPLQQLHFKVAFAPTRNNFKNVVEINENAQSAPELRRAGSKTVTFTIPG